MVFSESHCPSSARFVDKLWCGEPVRLFSVTLSRMLLKHIDYGNRVTLVTGSMSHLFCSVPVTVIVAEPGIATDPPPPEPPLDVSFSEVGSKTLLKPRPIVTALP